MRYIFISLSAAAIVCATIFLPSAEAQPAKAASRDWRLYEHYMARIGFSPLAQIATLNVARIARIGTYRMQSDTSHAAEKGPSGSEATIVVNGAMYLSAADRVVVLEPESGRTIWEYLVAEGAPSRRGIGYWAGDKSDPVRILFTLRPRLIALNAIKHSLLVLTISF
jgi:glucose dehydrogenase